jgi:hypothetical protein
MLQGQYGKKINDDLLLFKNQKNALNINPDSLCALRVLLELIVTNSWYYRKPKNFDSRINLFLAANSSNLRESTTLTKLTSLVDELSPPLIKKRALQSVGKLISGYASINDFTQELYELAKQEKNNDVLGEKGRDNFLRDFGYWDRIPIDRHEIRFMIRTGIFHIFSSDGKNDPLEKTSFHDTLSRFCKVLLQGKVVQGIELSNAPGIVDIFIWSYCAKERYSICGSTPKCQDCVFASSCFFTRNNIQMVLNKMSPNSDDQT